MTALRRHARFLIAFTLGLAALLPLPLLAIDPVLRALVAVNLFFLAYLLLMARLALATSPQDLRRHAAEDDEGMPLILTLAVGAVIVALAAVFLVLNRRTDGLAELLFALAAVPLGWAMLHVLAAFRYAHLYYSGATRPGLTFPDPAPFNPGIQDFLYVAFTIGMTAQTSDVQATSPALRRAVLVHSVGAFFYNTVILALAVNAALALSR
jgi:uncharacterized membrane protein